MVGMEAERWSCRSSCWARSSSGCRSTRWRASSPAPPATALAYANKLAPTDRPDVGYAMSFPAMTIVKALFVDIVLALP